MRNIKRKRGKSKMGKGSMRKAQNMMARDQARISKKFMGDRVNPLTAGWMFNTWYEKIILIVLMVLGIWKLGGFFFGIF